MSALIAHASKDRGQEQREGQQGDQRSYVDEGKAPCLPIRQGRIYVAFVEVLRFGCLVVRRQTTSVADAVLGVEKAGAVWPVRNHPAAASSN